MQQDIHSTTMDEVHSGVPVLVQDGDAGWFGLFYRGKGWEYVMYEDEDTCRPVRLSLDELEAQGMMVAPVVTVRDVEA